MSNRKRIVAIPKTTTTFLPTSIAGCQLWLDGTDPAGNGVIPANDATVSTWVDKSGLVNNATTYSGITTYSTSLKALFFSNSGFQTSIVTPTNRVGSGFFVVRATVNSANVVFQGSGLGYGGRQFRNDNGTILKTIKENIVEMFLAGPTVLNTLMLVGYVDDGNNLTHCLNGTLYTTTTATTFTEGRTILIGKSFNGEHLIGYIHEVVLFNINVTTTQRQQVESYLAQKWGLTASLTAGHPGLTTTVYTIAAAVPKQKISSIPKTIFVSFLPTSITGCALWMDGADPAGNGVVPANGATVSTWADKSGSGNNATRLGGSMTYTTSRGVVFDGTSASGYSVPSGTFPTGNTYYSIFLVVETSLPANKYSHMFSSGSAVGGQAIDIPIYPNGLVETGWWTTNIQSAAGVVTANTKIILGTTYNSSGLRLYGNATSIAFSSSLGARNSPSTLGYIGTPPGGPGGSQNFIGTMYEALLFSGEMTNTQHQNVESYLAQKWGLTSSLPVGHPGLTTTVYGTTTPAATVRQKIGYIPFIPLAQYIQSFTYTGSNQTFTVPSRTTSITLYMWGAGGGGNTNYGGAGAMVQGVLSVTPGESLTIVVGQGGTIDGTTTFGGGGAGAGNMAFGGDPGIGYSGNGSPQNAGSGGGRSAIQRGGTDPTNDIVVAGGGGGGTYFSSDRGGAATFSGTANPGIGGLPGLGGTQSAGGAGGGTGQYGQGLGGSRGIGGNTYNTNIFNGGGGGGGGYYGGGGGGTNGGDGAGGGGGSSLTSTLSLISGQSVLGFNSTNGFTAPNNTSPYYVSGVGNGAPAINSNPRAGGNGRIVLVYMA